MSNVHLNLGSLEIGTVIIVTSFPPTLKMWKCFTFALKTGEEIAKPSYLYSYVNTVIQMIDFVVWNTVSCIFLPLDECNL